VLVENPGIGFEGARDAVRALEAFGGPDADVARARLALVLRRAGEVRAARVLERSPT
jgi:hypothetical protein